MASCNSAFVASLIQAPWFVKTLTPKVKRVHEVPHLAKLQAEHGGKTRITMRVDNDTLAVRAEMAGGNYQTLMNDALRQFAQGLTFADVVRETIRQELHHN